MEDIEFKIKIQDLNLHCRTCLSTLPEKGHSIEDIRIPLIKLLSYAGLEMPQKENFPNLLCDPCYEIINKFEEFQNKTKRSTKYLEDLLKASKTKAEADNIEKIETNFKTLEADPLDDNSNFEAVLVKLEIEMNETSSGEEDINEDVDELMSNDSNLEKDSYFKNVQQSLPESSVIKSSKSESLQIVCKYGCGRKFLRTHNADAHYRFKHKANAENIKAAEKSTSENPPRVFNRTCNICFKNFSTLGGLRSHMTTHGDVRPFQCDQCNRGFNLKARLKRHIRETHQENPPEIPCKYGCGKMFTRHESAMNHYRVKHILPEKGIVPKTNTYVCEDCGKTFKTMHNLKEHSYTHRPHTDRPFQCEQCQKRFISKRPYEIHLLRHAGIKNFECKVCGLKTTTHNELRNHMNHHTKARQVNCPICSKTYTSPDNLRRHTLVVHQGVKNYKCRFCEEKFGKPDHLKHHEMRHTGERPHKCQICERAFIQLVALKAHIKTHNKANKTSAEEPVQ